MVVLVVLLALIGFMGKTAVAQPLPLWAGKSCQGAVTSWGRADLTFNGAGTGGVMNIGNFPNISFTVVPGGPDNPKRLTALTNSATSWDLTLDGKHLSGRGTKVCAGCKAAPQNLDMDCP